VRVEVVELRVGENICHELVMYLRRRGCLGSTTRMSRTAVSLAVSAHESAITPIAPTWLLRVLVQLGFLVTLRGEHERVETVFLPGTSPNSAYVCSTRLHSPLRWVLDLLHRRMYCFTCPLTFPW